MRNTDRRIVTAVSEALESRRLLTSSLVSGVLTITGTSGNNTIDVSLISTKIRVKESGLVDKDYTASQVTKIVADGKAGNDKITINANITKNAELRGGSGNDTLRGGGGTDALLGQDGNDNLEGGAKNDFLDGGKGNDAVDYSARTASVTAKLTFDSSTNLLGGNGGASGEADTFAAVETLIGSSGNDKLSFYGSDGNQTSIDQNLELRGGPGKDSFIANPRLTEHLRLLVHGDSGNDSISYDTLDATTNRGGHFQILTTLMGDSGNDSFTAGNTDAFANIDGGSGYDVESADRGSNEVDDVIDPGVEEYQVDSYQSVQVTGNSLNNRIVVRCNYATVDGAGGDDYIVGGGDFAFLRGGSGNDTIVGDAFNELLRGDAGNDLLIGNAGNDDLIGDAGNDTIKGGAGDDSIEGGFGNDSLLGEAGNDFIDGDIGGFQTSSDFDTLSGGDGNDTIYSSDTGTNLVHGDAGNDSLYGSTKLDTIYGDAGNDLITGSSGNDELHGGAGNDTIQAGDGDDKLFGDAGNDLLQGQNGNDTLNDLSGILSKDKDTLDGGDGSDVGTGDAKDTYISVEKTF